MNLVRKFIASCLVLLALPICIDAGWEAITPRLSSFTMRSVSFVDTLTGWIAGDSFDIITDTLFGNIYKTVNGGKNWNKQIIANDKIGRPHLQFISNENGWCSGRRNDSLFIYNSIDGGVNWNIQYSMFRNLKLIEMNAVYFANANKGWAVGDNGLLLRTVDGGKNWIDTFSISNYLDVYLKHEPFSKVFFVDENIGWAVGGGDSEYGMVIKTTDGGKTWATVYKESVRMKGYRSCFFIDQNRGWVGLGSVPVIARTSDGGQTWDTIQLEKGDFYDMHFTSKDVGWVVGKDDSGYALICRTSDGGLTWKNVTIPKVKATLYALDFSDPNHGWAVGDNGTILKTTDGGGYPQPVINTCNTTSHKANGLLSVRANKQNVTFQYSLPQAQKYSFDIYNVVGCKVANVASGKAVSGMSSASWNYTTTHNGNVSSGIYYAVLRTDGNAGVSRINAMRFSSVK
jgi:photosystem II stability/assembly factor-like uncharacterized protein